MKSGASRGRADPRAWEHRGARARAPYGRRIHAASRRLRPRRARASPALALAVLSALVALPAAAHAQTQPIAVAPALVDGPSAPGAGPTALTSSIARDGTGALAYLKPVAGTLHVFVSALLGGTFAPPVQIDGTLPSGSSAPLVAAGTGGQLVVAFLNGSNLYVAERPNALHRLSALRLLASGASHPALSISPFGKAYLAFTVPDGAGSDVRLAYDGLGVWAIAPAALNLRAGDDAGTGSGGPAVAVAGDGVAIVAWGEGGHIITRRVWRTAASTVTEQADAPLPGCSEVSADEPAIGTGGDSSFGAVAFHELVSCGGQTESRVLVNRLHSSRFDGVATADGPAGTAPGGADRPQAAVGEYGSGWVTAETASQNVAVTALAQGENPRPGGQLNLLPNASRSYATPSMAGLFATVIAWQHDPGTGGAFEIRARYADTDAIFGPEFVLSSPAAGPTNAAAGLTAGGDVVGDAAVAWVQSTPAGDELVADELFRGPGAPTPTPAPGYLRTTQPSLVWGAAYEPWGSVNYAVTVDGAAVGRTTATSIATPAALAQGRHTWQVNATNQAGLSSGPQTGSFFIDTLAPVVTVALPAHGAPGRAVKLVVNATDHPSPLTAADSSGIAAVVVRWGDGSVELIGHHRRHVYLHPGRYRVRVIVVDRAGNATTTSMLVHITAPKPKPKPKPKSKPKAASGPARV